MEITNELSPMLDAEAKYIAEIKTALRDVGETLTEQAERHLRMGFRTKAIVDLRLKRGLLDGATSHARGWRG